MRYVNEHDKTITRIVEELSIILECSKSCLWLNVRSLRRAGLLKYNNGKTAGLTKPAVIIVRRLE
ncbi:hypothetical protein GF352_00825 [archaeon]|nr:hypothetical protein [archaeon]